MKKKKRRIHCYVYAFYAITCHAMLLYFDTYETDATGSDLCACCVSTNCFENNKKNAMKNEKNIFCYDFWWFHDVNDNDYVCEYVCILYKQQHL